jgi:hypothetical protein
MGKKGKEGFDGKGRMSEALLKKSTVVLPTVAHLCGSDSSRTCTIELVEVLNRYTSRG